jgi:hypothetical protein
MAMALPKVAAAEATGRQAASFVLGCVAALTVVLILMQRRPEDLVVTSRPVSPVQFFGGGSSSSSSGRDGTSSPSCSSSSPSSAAAGRPPPQVIVAADHQSADDATKQQPAAAAGANLRRLPPASTTAHRQPQEVCRWLIRSAALSSVLLAVPARRFISSFILLRVITNSIALEPSSDIILCQSSLTRAGNTGTAVHNYLVRPGNNDETKLPA